MLMSTIFTSLIMPLQVHPMTYGHWQHSQTSMVEAVIVTARIIGLPRMKDLDKAMYSTIYINEFLTGPVYQVHPRRAFIREFVK
jgi:hypothetical protein